MPQKITDPKLKKKYALLTLRWCQENLGINPRKRTKLTFFLSEKTRNITKHGKVKRIFVVYGRYCFWKNKITIYLSNCYTLEDIVGTVIHEYTHYLQSRTKYKKYEKTHTYSIHPLERSAVRNEVKYTKVCSKLIKKSIIH